MLNEITDSLSYKALRFTVKSGVEFQYREMTDKLRGVFSRNNEDIVAELNKVEIDPKFDSKINKAVKNALSVVCIMSKKDGPINIFSGNLSSVLLDSKGQVVWSINELYDDVKSNSDYGEDLRPVAWKKAVAAMVLHKQYGGSDMDDPNDFEMLQEFGFKHHKGGVAIKIGYKMFFLGVSGALPDKGYATKAGILTAGDKITSQSLQGAFDQEFGKLVEYYAKYPHRGISDPIIPRPEIAVSHHSNQ